MPSLRSGCLVVLAGDAAATTPSTARAPELTRPPHIPLPSACLPASPPWQVREVRLVRREGRSSVCLVLLRFDAQASADGFYRDFNGRAVRLSFCCCCCCCCRCALTPRPQPTAFH